jgi:hypothetical protein
VQEILGIEFVLDSQCGPILASEAKLPGDHVESFAKRFDRFRRIEARISSDR